jgi:AraC-like DNA-binding protein
MIVRSELQKLGVHFLMVELGQVEVMERLTEEHLHLLNIGLNNSGLAVIDDKRSILIEKIKVIIIELIHYSDKQINIKFSNYLSEKLNHDYTYLANIFSENQCTTIEHFFLTHKIERVKELLIYGELNITEVADKMHYSSVAHLSNQFKRMTGLTPSQYRHLRFKDRKPLENV